MINYTDMKTIQLKTVLLALNDEPIKNSEGKDFTVGEALANIMLSDKVKSFDKFKSYDMAKKFYKQESIELDAPDFEKVKAIVKESEYSPVVAGQIEEIFSKL